VAKLRKRISVSKRARQKFDLERSDLRKLDDVEVEEKYHLYRHIFSINQTEILRVVVKITHISLCLF
jgi:hypothetical protein